MNAYEVNFDGLIGPSHNYAGLAFGNLASINNASRISSPQTAALQGLAKMWQLKQLGLQQAVIPPQERPAVEVLRRLGFSGNDAQVLQSVARQAPELLRACSSASSMWTANAATVSASADCADGKVHLTVANLHSKFHRSIEAETTARILQALFADSNHFVHHAPLPGAAFADEGAANHTRLCADPAAAGLEIFVYGQSSFDSRITSPSRYPARQTLEACQSIARLHQLSADNTLFVQQNPEVIDQGVFHNDVIAVGNRNLLLFHELAFVDKAGLLQQLQQRFPGELHCIEVKNSRIDVASAVQSYLFNSQLVSLDAERMVLIAPLECQENPKVQDYLAELLASQQSPLQQVHYLDVRESMQNGGGPACLRLRVPLTETELRACNQHVLLTEQRYQQLCDWVKRHYRDRLHPDDLADPQLLNECRSALDELTQLLRLGSVYPFQREAGNQTLAPH